MNFNLDGFAVMLPALALLWVINKRAHPRGNGQNAVNVIKMILAFIAGCGMVYTFLGTGLAGFINWVSGISPGLRDGIPLALVFILAGAAILDIAFDKRADKGAQICAMLAPTILVLVVAGAIGSSGGHAVHTTYQEARAQIVKIGGHR